MKYKLISGATGLCLGLLMAASASAGWGSSGGSYGYGSSGGYRSAYGSSGGYLSSYGSSGGYSYASYYASSGGSSGGSSGYYPGPLRRLALGIHNHVHDHMAAKRARIAARRAYYGSSGYSSHGSSGGYSVSYGSSGGYSSSYGSSGGYSASYGSSGGHSSGGYTTSYRAYTGGSSGGSVSYGSTGSTYYGAAATPSYSSSNILASSVSTTDSSVHLTVAVPAEAKIFVNGNETTSTGAVRQFVSHGLESGKSYRFQLRAEMAAANGEMITEEKEVVATAGARQHVQFAFADTGASVETAVTLNVPEGATVRLAGSDTSITGDERTYRTSRMKAGEVWDNYEIEVAYEGRIKKQNIRLIAGDKLSLSFNFDEDMNRVAAR